MSEGHESRDSENNWVIPSVESFPVETVGAEQDRVEEAAAAASKPANPPDSEETVQPPDVKPDTELGPAPQEEPQRPDKGQVPPPDTEATSAPSTVGGDLEEVSCSSSDDDVEGLRKRVGRGAAPVSVGPCSREAGQQDTDAGSSMNLSTLLIAAFGLICIGLLIFTGGSFSADEESPQSVVSRSVKAGDKPPPQVISDIQEWIEQHADQFTGDPNSLQVVSGLLDKVAKENQDIRHMQAKLQAQKEELEALLSISDGENVTSGPNHPAVTEENLRLKEALLKEETAHLSAKEELQNLQEKLEVLESSDVEKESLVVENSQLKVELGTLQTQIEGFLPQKETLVAESQMLRQELDKQRLLVVSIRQDLDNLVTKSSEGEDEKLLRERISEMSSKLAMEAQRSETWEKKYVEHAQRRKTQVGEERRDHHHKEWKRADKSANLSSPGGDLKKPHYKHSKEHSKRWTEESHQESQHEEWKTKKQEDRHWRDKKHRHWEGEKAGGEVPEDSENWKNKAREHRSKDSAHHRHHQGESGEGFHPRKGQRDFTDSYKRPQDGDKRKDHRHHDHNKFWKKLSDHQYRVPEGCSGLEDCARKDGVDLFNVELKPVQRKHFEEVLLNFLTKSQLSEHLPELTPLLDGFFEGQVFSHHKIRFKDFVDDVEDFLEDLARKETGDDDIVDDFERYVYTNFFGEAATKKRFAKKDEQRKTKYYKQSGKLETYDQGLNRSNHKHPVDNKPIRTDHHVESRDLKMWPTNTPNEEKSDHKFEKEHKPNAKSHHRSPKYNDHAGNDGSFHHHGHHSEKKPKYPDNKPGGGQHNDRHFDKKYEKDGDWKKRQDKHNSYKKQPSLDEESGIDSYKYKGKSPNKVKEDREHEHYWSKKREKDANNKLHQLSESYGDHRDHKPWTGGDHRHGQPDFNHKFNQHYPTVSYNQKQEDDGRRRGHHFKYEEPGNGQEDYQKHNKDKHGNYHQKHEMAKDRDGDYHHKHDKGHEHRDYPHKHDKGHDQGGNKDGDYHHKHDKDLVHRNYPHKHDKGHEHGDYYSNQDKVHEDRGNRDGDYDHKHDQGHKHGDYHHKHGTSHKHGDYVHKHDKTHNRKNDGDGDYHHKHDKGHKHGDYHKYYKDHKHGDNRDGDYHHDKSHEDGDYHKHGKDHKHKDDRDEDYHHKYDKEHRHTDDRDRNYHKDKDHHKHGHHKDRHGHHNNAEESRPMDNHHKHDDPPNFPRRH
ncbi:pre-B-cell leukemia transcription factor-interacting protein 1 isoform 2-T5 [Anomaloglossus baeobatrachus]